MATTTRIRVRVKRRRGDELKKMLEDRYRGVLGVTTDSIVSSDIIRDTRASVVDLSLTQVVDGDLVKVMSWYDNEWGYSSQIVREALRIAEDLERVEGRVS